MERRESKKESSPRWFFWLMGIYIVVMIVLFIVHDHATRYRKGMGGYWWAYLLPVVVGLLVGLVLHWKMVHRGGQKSDKWIFNGALGLVGAVFVGIPISLLLVTINDYSETTIRQEDYRIISWYSSRSSKGGTKYHIEIADSLGKEHSFSIKAGYADAFTLYSKARLKVQEGCFGGRFIDVNSSDVGIFSGKAIPEDLD